MGGMAVEKFYIATDQMIPATEVAKQFKAVRDKAKLEPQYILDRSTIDSVLVGFELFQKLVERLQELEEENLMLTVANRLEEYEKDPSVGIPWSQIRREPLR
jgi:hypothetical protein